MKRSLILILMSLNLLLLTSCKSAEVKLIETHISEIVVNEDSGKLLTEIRAEYNALSESDKKKVSNIQALNDYENAYNQLFADKVDSLISLIGSPVTYESKDAIEAARQGFDALTKDQQKLVSKFGVLVSAEQNLEKATVDYCICLVEKLQSDDEFTNDDIVLAQSIYSRLSDSQKRKVDGQVIDAQKVIDNAHVRRVIRLISNIDYTGKEPSKVQLIKIIEAFSSYQKLSTEQKTGVDNSATLDKAIQAYNKFVANREKTDAKFAKRHYIEKCVEIDYDALLSYPKESKGKLFFVKITVNEIEHGWFSDTIKATTEDNEPIILNDSRTNKEPVLRIGDMFVVYGEANGNEKVKVTEENSGWFGTNWFSKTVEEYEVPVIKFQYTDIKNPYEDETVDSEFEELINRLTQLTKDWKK